MYILYNEHAIIATEDSERLIDGMPVLIPEDEVLARYPQGTKIHLHSFSPLTLYDAKRIFRIQGEALARRPVVSLAIEPSVIAADGHEAAHVRVRAIHAGPEEIGTSVRFQVSDQVVIIPVQEQEPGVWCGEFYFRTTQKGVHYFELDWPEAMYVMKVVEAV